MFRNLSIFAVRIDDDDNFIFFLKKCEKYKKVFEQKKILNDEYLFNICKEFSNLTLEYDSRFKKEYYIEEIKEQFNAKEIYFLCSIPEKSSETGEQMWDDMKQFNYKRYLKMQEGFYNNPNNLKNCSYCHNEKQCDKNKCLVKLWR